MPVITPKDDEELNTLYEAVRMAGKRMSEAEKAYLEASEDYRRASEHYDKRQKELST